jgi:hypothetical protein
MPTCSLPRWSPHALQGPRVHSIYSGVSNRSVRCFKSRAKSHSESQAETQPREDLAGLDAHRDARRLVEVLRVDVGGEAILGVVRQPDLGFGRIGVGLQTQRCRIS